MVKWVAVHGERARTRAHCSAVLDRDRALLGAHGLSSGLGGGPERDSANFINLGNYPTNHAACFLAIVEPSLDGLGRIVRLLEPAHRFVYAKNQMYRWWREGARLLVKRDTNTTIDVIKRVGHVYAHSAR